MSASKTKRVLLYALSSRPFMKTSGCILMTLCPTTIIGAGLIGFNHQQILGWGWPVLALCVAAAVSYSAGFFMLTHSGEPQ